MTTEYIIDVALTLAFFIFCIPTLRALIKGAPFVPTPMRTAEIIFTKGKLKKGSRFYDLGCGDGRFPYLAEKMCGANATGYELSPLVYLYARIRKFLWKSKADIRFGNFRNQDLSDADAIFCYLMPDALAYTIPKFKKELRPGTRIISYAFPIGKWKPIELIPNDPKLRLSPIRVYEIGKEE